MSSTQIDTTPWWERYRTDVTAGGLHHIDVFFRSLSPTLGAHDKRRRLLTRLDEAIDRDSLDSYDISILGEGMCLCDDCRETRIARHMHETLTMLREGGADDVEPFGFDERNVDSQLTDEHYNLLVPPNVSIAVYIDDSLRGVFPAEVDGICVTVEEFLDALTTLDRSTVASQAEM